MFYKINTTKINVRKELLFSVQNVASGVIKMCYVGIFITSPGFHQHWMVLKYVWFLSRMKRCGLLT